MDREVRSALSSFQRVQEFLTQHPPQDVPPVLGTQAAQLDDVIAQLSSEAVEQESGKRFARVHAESQRTLRGALYAEHMQPIARVAREVFGLSGMDRAFRLPKLANVNQPLLAAAGAMADAAEQQKEVFLKHGMAPDFVVQLQAAAALLDEARNAKTVIVRRRIIATATMKDQAKRGRKAVRLLNALLAPKLAKDPALLAAWRSAKRVRPTSAAGVPGEETSLKVA